METPPVILTLAITGCVFCGIIAGVQICIFVLEAVLWRNRAAKVFKLFQTTVDHSASLAANQGFYHLILSGGLIWAVAYVSPLIMLFFLAAISTTGIFSTITLSIRFLFIQVIPAFIGFICVDFGFYPSNNWSYWKHPFYLLFFLIAASCVTFILSFIVKRYFLEGTPNVSSKIIPLESTTY